MTDEPASAGAAAAPRTIVMAWWVEGTTFKNRSHRYARIWRRKAGREQVAEG